MSLNVKLEAFEGPLDLLLHLVEKNKLDIYDIPIVEITDQYMEYVREMAKRDLDLASEFLVMAARLLMIKSKMLLPATEDEETQEDAETMKEELTARLLELKMFKYIAGELKAYADEGQKRFFGHESIPADIMKYRPRPNIDRLLYGIDTSVLCRAYSDALRRAADRVDVVRSSFGNIEPEKVDVGRTLSEIKETLKKEKSLKFNDLISSSGGVLTEIVTFLVLLELMRSGYVTASQDGIGEDIDITVQKDVEPFGASGEFFQ